MALWPGAATAQGPDARLPSPIVTLDQDALFARSLFGQRVQEELTRDRDALAAENREIEADLIREEQALTDQRPGLPASEFSTLAADFDDKVQQIRTEQDAKSRLLQQRLERERQAFTAQVGPLLAELVQRRGALAVIDRGAILLAFEGIDITDEAIALVDERLGAGDEGELTGPRIQPDQPPAPDAATEP